MCAKTSQPTGGPKDETPPALISITPENGTRNFTSREIKLVFDEDVQAKNARTQILITPRTDVSYELKVRRNEVTLIFDSLLDANTTYTISFRESIQDLTEGNPPERLQLAFSTGPELDSLSLSGNVYNILDGSIPEKATVVLYRSTDTTDIFTDLPYYFTETTDSGKFLLQNLKQGDYKLYAINDNNRNLKAESSKEPYGFIPGLIRVDTTATTYSIPLVNLDLGKLRLLSARPSASIYLAKFNKSFISYTAESPDTVISQIDPTDPTVLQFFPSASYAEGDSVQTIISVTDSLGYSLTDTVYTRFNLSSTRRSDYNVGTVISPVFVSRPIVNAELNFTKPSSLFKSDSLYIFIDSLNIINFDTSHFNWNTNRTQLRITYSLNADLFKTPDNTEEVKARDRNAKLPYLHIGKQSFLSVQSDTIKSRSYQLSFLREQDVSTLIVNLLSDESNVIIQLLDSQNKVYREFLQEGRKQFTFNNLPPGDYTLRAVIDTNQNGKWDPGNFLEQLPPEPIIHFVSAGGEQIMNLRANFVREETLQITGE
ncbi:Ig-like domain-containing protein [Fulvivirga sedimenti]|uniref:Ig-like domain-containing protein n=1 Tax=Fulvivirga sedimenti TaxID=2879465 RepID=A0A9X1L134_9BACT|nr:Ig-like domain-containing protein [Fulvivirga sedimenti]MCA6078514.1 Ig-like domain-containing protein [Fulvivirga sedimenti]